MLHHIREALRERRGLFITLGVFALALALALQAFGGVEEQHLARQQEALRQAVLRAAVACYSVEGVYPSDAAYLQENYGLHYDTDTFILQYDAFAENILPEIRVLIRGVE